MKPVYQDPDEPECGAACIAMLARVTIDEARCAVYGDKPPKRLGRKKVLGVLADHFDVNPQTKDCVRLSSKFSLAKLRGDALLQGSVLFKDGKSWKKSLHWLVWDHRCQCVRDPLGFSDAIQITSATEVA